MNLQIEDKTEYFQKPFLKVNINIKIIIRILFLKLNNADLLFKKKNLYRDFILLTKLYLILNKSKSLIK